MVITTITKPDQLLRNVLIFQVLAQIFMVHSQPSIIVPLTGTILKTIPHGNTFRTHTLRNKTAVKKNFLSQY